MIEFTVKSKNKISNALKDAGISVPYFSLMKLLRNKDVKVNGKRVNNNITLNSGDTVVLYYTVKQEEIRHIYIDDNVLVCYKKSGITSEDFYNALLNEYKTLKFIHRLDRNTDGVMIFALNSVAEAELVKGFKNRTFEKYYIAEVLGKFDKKKDVLTAYLFKDAKKSQVTIYNEKVKGSVLIKTGYEVVEEKEETSVIKVRLYTGKTHQIRAHLAFISHPILGDGKYGDSKTNKRLNSNSQVLTAKALVLHFDKDSPLYYLDGKSFSFGE